MRDGDMRRRRSAWIPGDPFAGPSARLRHHCSARVRPLAARPETDQVKLKRRDHPLMPVPGRRKARSELERHRAAFGPVVAGRAASSGHDGQGLPMATATTTSPSSDARSGHGFIEGATTQFLGGTGDVPLPLLHHLPLLTFAVG